ncbi:MAG: hypothetical protein Q8P67_26000 [archaeon]|nr:hypothetical protein [archaeon]
MSSSNRSPTLSEHPSKKNTPTPADALAYPFARQAPSVHTFNSVVGRSSNTPPDASGQGATSGLRGSEHAIGVGRDAAQARLLTITTVVG